MLYVTKIIKILLSKGGNTMDLINYNTNMMHITVIYSTLTNIFVRSKVDHTIESNCE